MIIANFIVLATAIYAVVGFLFAIAFAFKGVASIDASAAHAPLGFRLIILPGAAALWPVLLHRWIRSRRGPRPGSSAMAPTATLEHHS